MAYELFPFRFFDPIRKRWVSARYKASRESIVARYEKWEITGRGWMPPVVESHPCAPDEAQGADPTRCGGDLTLHAGAGFPWVRRMTAMGDKK
jgi:hypothetical protein